jgi:hypothetical protein
MNNPQSKSLGIVWKIEYDDTPTGGSGHHHVLENVPEFPPSP